MADINHTNIDAVIHEYDWFRIFTAHDKPATDVPARLIGLIHSKDNKEAERWYDKLENTIVIQGGVSESAYPSLRVLLAALETEWMTSAAMESVFELIHQCLFGYCIRETVRRGNMSVADECIKLIRENISILERHSNKTDILQFIYNDILLKIEPQ